MSLLHFLSTIDLVQKNCLVCNFVHKRIKQQLLGQVRKPERLNDQKKAEKVLYPKKYFLNLKKNFKNVLNFFILLHFALINKQFGIILLFFASW